MEDIIEKLKVLGIASRFDASCGWGHSTLPEVPGVYRSKTNDGGCCSLLKILMTNYCEYDCAYCQNRKSNNIKRVSFSPDEICKLTTTYFKDGIIDGLFLSSGLIKNPDFTMELMLKAVKKLRIEYNYHSYIHLKIIPGTDETLINEALKYANRVSINLEIPNLAGLHSLCPEKDENKLFKPMIYIHDKLKENNIKKTQTTQLIVGVVKDNDFQVLKLAENLYKRISLQRVYYSSFVNVNKLPINEDKNLKLREKRLYQADWLLRVYKFELSEIIKPKSNLPLELDPKTAWAIENINLFPIELTNATFDMLIRIPGIGFISAKKIIALRKTSSLSYDRLEKMGVHLKKAKHFITINGKFYGFKGNNIEELKALLLERDEQLSLFDTN